MPITNRVTYRSIAVAVTVATLATSGSAPALQAQAGRPPLALDSLLLAHAEAIAIEDGRLVGPGAATLIAAASATRHLVIAEEHDLPALAELTTVLFDTLAATADYRYLAVEQGRLFVRMFLEADAAGGRDSARAFVRTYPRAPTFASDAELQMLLDIAARSRAGHAAVWGIDQDMGATHILDQILRVVPEGRVARLARRHRQEAVRTEWTRESDTLYMFQVAEPAAFDSLATLIRTDMPDAMDLADLADGLRESAWLYRWNRDAQSSTPPSGFRNIEQREAMMQRFLAGQLREHDALGPEAPGTILKAGHWHTWRGLSPGYVITAGGMLDGLGRVHGKPAVIVSTAVVGGPDAWREHRGFLAGIAPVDQWTLFDLRPLRAWANAGRIADLPDTVRRFLAAADFALVFGGEGSGPRTWIR